MILRDYQRLADDDYYDELSGFAGGGGGIDRPRAGGAGANAGGSDWRSDAVTAGREQVARRVQLGVRFQL
jgi:hypothetical protein